MQFQTKILCFFFCFCVACHPNKTINQQQTPMQTHSEKHQFTNHLIYETSPYLLQHAHNPVDWYPWGKVALNKAKAENKPLLISIGYSACHWCHVMERESFEDTSVAKIMNENFICIKIDREERPDIDQIYMDAVQLMTGRGGWPLNAFALPDGRPVYGGTYFPKAKWMDICQQIANLHQQKPQEMEDYAKNLTKGIRGLNIIPKQENAIEFTQNQLHQIYQSIEKRYDTKLGGMGAAPKFPMPSIYQFLLNYHALTQNKAALQQVDLTLDKMALGGIYDQLGGGFARYSTDAFWKVPHFEKMLYDNAQLISLYARAYQMSKKPLYKKVVFESIAFVERELMDESGGFYSALDADSEGEEGKFYVWKKSEIEEILGADAKLFMAYFQVDKKGFWEHGNNILLIDESLETIAQKQGLELQEAEKSIENSKEKLLKERAKRIHPGLDDKVLASWNALMLKALLEAYQVFDEKHFLELANQNLAFLEKEMLKENLIYRTYKKGEAKIPAFIEDYALMIQAYLTFYESTFDEKHLQKANKLNLYAMENFFDEKSGLFQFVSKKSEQLISQKIDLNDNVIPSPNSIMAHNLFRLGKLNDQKEKINLAKKMIANVSDNLQKHASYYSNWAILHSNITFPFREIVVVGKDYENKIKALNQHYIPNKIVLAAKDGKSNLALLENRFVNGQTKIYICVDKACQLPVSEVEAALKQLKN